MNFSILIPAYNSANTILVALNSIKSQTHSEFEVLIIDDGSTDDTSAICKGVCLKDKRFKYFYQTNKGASAARNYGIMLAKCEYILFLDSDDFYSSDYLSEFKLMIESQSEYENFWCDYSSKLAQQNDKTCFNNIKLIKEDKSNIMNTPCIQYLNPLWNKAFKRDVIMSNNITMPEDLSLGEDLIFNLRYLDCTNGKIVINPSPLYHYSTANEHSLDRKYRENLLDIFNTIDEALLQYLHKWNVDEQQLKLFYNSVFFHYEKVLYNTYHPESKLTKHEKRTYNSTILKSEKFQSALRLTDCYINPLYKIAYKLRSWTMIQCLDKLINIKNKFN